MRVMPGLWNTLWKSGELMAAKSYGIKALNGNVEGLDELLSKLDMLPDMAAMAARDGIRKSADIVVAGAKAAALDGQIAQNITAEVERNGPKVHGEIFVQQGGYKTALWPVYVEMGTGPKGIASGAPKYPLPSTAYTQHPWKYYNAKLGHVVTTSGRYAQPYLWPAYEMQKPYIIADVKEAVRIYLAKKGGGGK